MYHPWWPIRIESTCNPTRNHPDAMGGRRSRRKASTGRRSTLVRQVGGSVLLAIFALSLGVAPALAADRLDSEILGRGLICLPNSSHVYCSWRKLPFDTNDTYKLYRADNPYDDSGYDLVADVQGTDYQDTTALNGKTYYYRVAESVSGAPGVRSRISRVTAGATKNYLRFHLQKPGDTISKVVPGDLNGDGVLDFVVMTPYQIGKYGDSDCPATPTSFKIESFYSDDGTWKSGWYVDTGYAPVGTHCQHTHMMPMAVWDLDGDLRAEVITRWGTDGKLAVVDGETGQVRAQTPWPTWTGAAERYPMVVAYLEDADGDGTVDPYIVAGKGLYLGKQRFSTYVYDGCSLELRHDLTFDDSNQGRGTHGLPAVDIDNDGRDEVIPCGTILEVDSKGEWLVKYEANQKHNDGCFAADIVPESAGADVKVEVFMAPEGGGGGNMSALLVSPDDQILWSQPMTDPEQYHNGWERGWCADISAAFDGLECYAYEVHEASQQDKEQGITDSWNAHIFSADGADITPSFSGEIPDPQGSGATTRWPMDWVNGEGVKEMYTYCNAPGVASCGSYTGWPGDILGDSREEAVVFPKGSSYFSIYTNVEMSASSVTTPLADSGYRAAISRVGVGYNTNWIPERSNQDRTDTVEAPDDDPPFGSFDSPTDGSTVRSSVPVTGWALDDVQVASVKIYRDPVASEDPGLKYIGEAIFAKGARTDIEEHEVYGGYPNSDRAGWGYMLLTNFLPDGDGAYKLYAFAIDTSGNSAQLGSKTIFVDNDSAVNPFGAIDTPAQGGSASGSQYVVFGWALTPQPNTIPTDGTTIKLSVDGFELPGHPAYNQYREDIATLFPGYNNSQGAIGYYYLDTTAYSDGVHTIVWNVQDNAGNVDGMGSRYFEIRNSTHCELTKGDDVTGHGSTPTGKSAGWIEVIDADWDGYPESNGSDNCPGMFNPAQRATDCQTCGNGSCDNGETCTSCSQDCGICPSCGDGSCNNGETCTSCSQDCGVCSSCGDGLCSSGETCSSCTTDCGVCGYCTDGICNNGETCESCAADCGACGGCGDGLCLEDETCLSCPGDCGACHPRTEATASSEHASLPAADAIDGNNNTAWSTVYHPASHITDPEWLAFWSSAFRYVDHVVVVPRMFNGSSVCVPLLISVYYSGTNGEWNWIKDVYPPASIPVTGYKIEFPTVFANGILLVAEDLRDDTLGGYYFQMAEAYEGDTAQNSFACGDGQCAGDETCSNCPSDCGTCAFCGDGTCNGDETCSSCAADCGACQYCGDGSCNNGETCSSCAQDCGACQYCGDGSCNNGETCSSCALDCGTCQYCGDGSCNNGESCSSCALDCGACPFCGDGSCNNGETVLDCPSDCEPLSFDGGFETAEGWSFDEHADWPGTSTFRSTWGTADQHSGERALALSNQAYGTPTTTFIAAGPGSHTVSAWLRGEIQETSFGGYSLRVYFYDESLSPLTPNYQNAASCTGSSSCVSRTWAEVSGTVTAPTGTAFITIKLLSYMYGGWISYDDITLNGEVLSVATHGVDGGFETDTGWDLTSAADFPATSLYRSTWGTANEHSGTRALAISNQAYAYPTARVAVGPGTSIAHGDHTLSAWTRGEMSDSSEGGWIIRASYYDSSGAQLSYQNAAICTKNASCLTDSWTQQSGMINVPTEATEVGIQLLFYMANGWVSYDDVAMDGTVLSLATHGVDGGFEDESHGWSYDKPSSFPGTGIRRDASMQHTGSYGLYISNLAWAYPITDHFIVEGDTTYEVSAWLRGEMDESSYGGWILRVYYYDATQTLIASEDVQSCAGSASCLPGLSWRQEMGRVTVPAGAASARVRLYFYRAAGWIAYDDVVVSSEYCGDGICSNGETFDTCTADCSCDGSWELGSYSSEWLEDVAFGASRFVAVGNNGTVLTSSDGVDWSVQSTPTSNKLHGVTYGADQFVAVGYLGTILTSPDGVSWTKRTSGTTSRFEAVTYGNGLYVAVGRGDPVIFTSTDGITWAQRQTPTALYAVTYGGGLFVAVGANITPGGARVWTSADGISWTERTTGWPGILRDVAYGNGRWVAVGDGGGVRASEDGISWSDLSSRPVTTHLKGITFAGNRFVVVGHPGVILTSQDGQSWSSEASPTTAYLHDVTYGSLRFAVVGDDVTLYSQCP